MTKNEMGNLWGERSERREATYKSQEARTKGCPDAFFGETRWMKD